jgi:hypothetical protein
MFSIFSIDYTFGLKVCIYDQTKKAEYDADLEEKKPGIGRTYNYREESGE